VMIDFWASWCQPCMMEMPNVVEQYKAFKDKGFEIIGVSLDHEKDAWLQTIQSGDMTWKHGWDLEDGKRGKVADMYGVTSIPHTVLIDKTGKIVAKDLRGDALKEKLAELLP
jgi:thiol-disulfide isomerase/thioredoxin